MADNNFELVKRELASDPAQGAILSRVLKDLSPVEVERLRTKAAEGKMGLELEQIAKVHQFQASTADVEQFINTVKRLELSQSNPFSSYKATGEYTTATGTTTIQAKKGCYIATRVYRSEDHANVLLLRRFRDEHLEQSHAGRVFCRVYYNFAPAIADSTLLGGKTANAVRCVLDVICRRISKRLKENL